MKLKPIALLFCLCLFHLFNDFFWLKADTSSFLSDPCLHHAVDAMAYAADAQGLSALPPQQLSGLQAMSQTDTFLQQGELMLVFSGNDGRVWFSYKGSPITTDSGLHACLKFKDKFYGSDQLAWEATQPQANILSLEGSSPELPFTLRWQLEQLDTNRIRWEIFFKSDEAVNIDAGPYVNLILPYAYKRWVRLSDEGRFLVILPWQDSWSWASPPGISRYIGVRRSRLGAAVLPAIVLKIEHGLALDRTVPQNTDYARKARALDVQRRNDAHEPLKIGPGESKVFSAEIIIFDSDYKMESFLEQARQSEGR